MYYDVVMYYNVNYNVHKPQGTEKRNCSVNWNCQKPPEDWRNKLQSVLQLPEGSQRISIGAWVAMAERETCGQRELEGAVELGLENPDAITVEVMAELSLTLGNSREFEDCQNQKKI